RRRIDRVFHLTKRGTTSDPSNGAGAAGWSVDRAKSDSPGSHFGRGTCANDYRCRNGGKWRLGLASIPFDAFVSLNELVPAGCGRPSEFFNSARHSSPVALRWTDLPGESPKGGPVKTR